MMSLEHNATSKEELKEIAKFVEAEIGIEYEIDDQNLTIQILEPEKDEIEKIMYFLISKNFVVPQRSVLERLGTKVWEYCSSDSNHSIYRHYGHYFDVVDGGWCGGEEAHKETDLKFIEKLDALYKAGKVGHPCY